MTCRATQDRSQWRVLTNVVHWRRKWQPIPVFLPGEPHVQYEKAKRYDTRRWAPLGQKVSNVLLGKGRGQLLTAPERMKWLGQSRNDSVMDVSDGESKVWCSEEQYYIETWNIGSMNQGKLDMVKQEMARVNINILGIRELKRMGMGKFNSDDHYTYYCGQESLRRNGAAYTVNKRVQKAVLGCHLRSNRMISAHFQGKPFNK